MQTSASPPAARARVPRLPDIGYSGMPKLHCNHQLAPITFVWWASTPCGRQSKYLQAWTADRLRRSGHFARINGTQVPIYVPTSYYGKPVEELYASLLARGSIQFCRHLPQGYTWRGPALGAEHAPPSQAGPWHDGLFSLAEPSQAETPLRSSNLSLADARLLAAQILRAPAFA